MGGGVPSGVDKSVGERWFGLTCTCDDARSVSCEYSKVESDRDGQNSTLSFPLLMDGDRPHFVNV